MSTATDRTERDLSDPQQDVWPRIPPKQTLLVGRCAVWLHGRAAEGIPGERQFVAGRLELFEHGGGAGCRFSGDPRSSAAPVPHRLPGTPHRSNDTGQGADAHSTERETDTAAIDMDPAGP